MKTLKQFSEASGYLKVKSSDEQRFVDKHGVEVMPDANGNKDDVFKASKVKKSTSKRHGHESGADEAVYEQAMSASDRYGHHHNHAKALLKSIHEHVKSHGSMASSNINSNGRKGPNYGHVTEMEQVASSLSNLNDQLGRMGEYSMQGSMRESSNIDEKMLTPAEMKKREEVAMAIKRDNPKMPMGKKMAIATATAKKVAEDLDAAISELPSRLQDIMKEAFNRLNEENQEKFAAACATEEGCEKMIAFAIEKRGE